MKERGRWGAVLGGCVALAAVAPTWANNVAVSNVTLMALGSGQARIGFDLSWDNSWRDSTNFDATWLFAKYSVDGATWHHATLAASGTNPVGFSAGSSVQLDLYVPSDRKGAFVQRKAAGVGTVVSTGVRLVWNFATSGVSSNTRARVRVLAIEMVYVPEGPFYVGQDTRNIANMSPFPVTYINTPDMSKTNATTGSGTIADPYQNLVNGIGRPKEVAGTFNANYPNGYRSFYCMKYEISQGQWADFLNMLAPDQAQNHWVDQGAARDTITGSHPNFTASAPNRAVWFYDYSMAFVHGPAYFDWAALRPMSEMEFEKAARGPLLPVDKELAWGTTNFTTYTSLVSDGTAAEAPPASANANANIYISSSKPLPSGPIRCGAFATNGAGRVKAGGSYYGIMELSGNVSERVVPTGGWRTAWRTAATPYFSAVNGDGELDGLGSANETAWPSGIKSAATTLNPYGHKGGGFAHAWDVNWVSERYYAANDYAYAFDYGAGRGVRAP